jgi:hypothetical protein
LEAGGIEPRDPDPEVVLRQALARLGDDGLASCLAAICSEPDLANMILAWFGLPERFRYFILNAVQKGRVD